MRKYGFSNFYVKIATPNVSLVLKKNELNLIHQSNYPPQNTSVKYFQRTRRRQGTLGTLQAGCDTPQTRVRDRKKLSELRELSGEGGGAFWVVVHNFQCLENYFLGRCFCVVSVSLPLSGGEHFLWFMLLRAHHFQSFTMTPGDH